MRCEHRKHQSEFFRAWGKDKTTGTIKSERYMIFPLKQICSVRSLVNADKGRSQRVRLIIREFAARGSLTDMRLRLRKT